MSEQKESSVLFSLKELMNLEEDRIKGEEADRAASAAAAEQARLEAERVAREAEEARIRAEQERRRLEDQRAREEHARLEAIRQGEIEKARLEAEQRARLEAMEAQQKHERSLAAIKEDEGKKKLRNMLIGGAIFAVLVIGIGGFFAYKNQQQAEADKQAQAAQLREAQEELKRKTAAFEEAQKKADSIKSQLDAAQSEAERERLKAALADAQRVADSAKKSVGGGGPAPKAGDAPAAPKKKCTPGDPLCTDI
jgi:colicin import membrane protein